MTALSQQYFAAHPARGATSPAAVRVVGATVTVQNFIFNADGNTLTLVDTVRINQGESVQFNRTSGTHTITSGNNGDIDAGSLFNLPSDLTHVTQVVTFNTAGTFPYFCQVHTLNDMRGIVVVSPPLGVSPGSQPGAGFVAPPSPNPTRGAVAMRFAVTQSGRAQVRAYDAGGRTVATLFDRDVSPGTYSAAWTGRSGAGEPLAPGTYFLRLTAPGVRETRRITLVR